jgi:hypothetical protein
MRILTKRALLALAALCAIGVVGASSASAALPEFYFVSKGQHYSVTGKTEVVLYVAGEDKIICKDLNGSGTFTGAKTLTANLALTECAVIGIDGGARCTTAGAKEGEIKSEALEAELVYTSKANKEVGIVFNHPAVSKFATFSCSAYKSELKGGVIAQITTPVNKYAWNFTLKFGVSTSGTQVPAQYENEEGKKVTDVLQTTFPVGGLKEAALATESSFTANESIEIKA